MGVRRFDHHRAHPDELEVSRWPQSDHRARRRDAWAPAKPRPDETLIRALARAHRWRRLLEEGRFRSAGEIGEAEGVTRSFVNRLLRLTLLAPDIQEAILEGRQAKAMQLEEVTRTMPSGWEDQRDRFTASRPG